MAVDSIGNLGCPQGGHSSCPERITIYALMSAAKNMTSVTMKIVMPIIPFETGDFFCGVVFDKEIAEFVKNTA